jgi:hypothetical protein
MARKHERKFACTLALLFGVFWPFLVLHAQTNSQGKTKQSDVIISISPQIGYALNFAKTSVISDEGKVLQSFSNRPYLSLNPAFAMKLSKNWFYLSLDWGRLKIGNFLQPTIHFQNNQTVMPFQFPVYRHNGFFGFCFGGFKRYTNWIFQADAGFIFIPNTYLDQNVGYKTSFSGENGVDSLTVLIQGGSWRSSSLLPKVGISLGYTWKIRNQFPITISMQWSYAQGLTNLYRWTTSLNTGSNSATLQSWNKGTFLSHSLKIELPLAKLVKIEH